MLTFLKPALFMTDIVVTCLFEFQQTIWTNVVRRPWDVQGQGLSLVCIITIQNSRCETTIDYGDAQNGIEGVVAASSITVPRYVVSKLSHTQRIRYLESLVDASDSDRFPSRSQPGVPPVVVSNHTVSGGQGARD
jgi:hypothetical protein